MQVGYGSSLVAQYSSSCSPFEEDVSFHASNAEDDLMGILSSDLLVSQSPEHQLEISERWSDISGLDIYSTQKISSSYNTRRNRPQRVASIEQPLPRNNRSNKGVRIPPSGRNTSKKACPAFKKKVVVRTLIYPKRGVSEDDSMAMGDEWGTERDPGFEDGQEDMLFSNKKKKKDRKQGIQCVSNEISTIHRSLQKPILNSTPRHARPPHNRPIRGKRSSKKDNQLCSGDISTQETTTPAPNSSDSSSEDILTVESNTTEMSHSTNTVTHLTVLPIHLCNTTATTQRTNSSTDSEHNMDTPKSPRIPSTTKLHPDVTDYSEHSRTSSEEENNKPEITPERPPSVVLHGSMPPPSLNKAPIYAVPVKIKPTSHTIKHQRKRSSSISGIEDMVAPPVPRKPSRYRHTKLPLLTPDRKLSQSFSTSDISTIPIPRRPAPTPPNISTEQHTPIADDNLNECWSNAETSIFPPPPPQRDQATQIMPQEEFDSYHLQTFENIKLVRTRSVENTNKINYSASCAFLTDENFDSDLAQRKTDSKDKRIQRKDAIDYEICRTKSLNFGTSETDTFTPMPGHQPPLTTIGYLPNSMHDSIDSPDEIIQMLNKIAHEKNMKIEISNFTTQESELSVPPLQMCSSANLSASNYEDCKGKKFKLVLTFHQLKDTSQDDRKISITTLRRVNVPLWSHQNKVKAAGLVKELSVREIKRQEAMYELYTTEVSYKLSLSILTKFRNDSRLSPYLPEAYRVMTQTDHTHLFSSTVAMLECSSFLATNLMKIVENSLVIESVTDLILNNISKFHRFIPYCKNQYYQNQKYKELMKNNPKFVEIITQLEKDKECHNLDLTSFLMLPVQRITRLPLLLSNILEFTPEHHDNYQSVKTALFKIQEIAYRCDVEAHRLSSLEGLHAISRSLVYPQHIKTLPIVDPKRHLVRRGEIFRVQWRMRKLMKPEIKFERIYLILFTDIAILTQLPKKCLKNDCEVYQVIDYCKRQLLTYRPIGIITRQPFPTRNRENFYMMSRWVVSRRQIPNAFALHMLENHRGRDACYLFVPNDPTEATRWAQAISPPLIPCMPGEQLYHEYESPQFQVISNYTAQLPDELSLDIGDVVSIRRKMPDGWFEGARMRDDKRGWFPSSHAVEVMNESTRNKNVRKAQELRRISTLIKYSDIV